MLIIEYSRNLASFPEAQVLAERNHAVTASAEIAGEADLKTRCTLVNSYAIGTANECRAFVSAQLRLLAGRTPEAKRDLSDRIAAVLRRLAPRPEGGAGALERGDCGHGSGLLHQRAALTAAGHPAW